MRSRLEAKWGYFLDNLGVEWEYEPFELGDGKRRAYIPDFLIRLKKPTLLECKPLASVAEFRPAQRRITKSTWTGPALIVGSKMHLVADGFPDISARGTLAAGREGWARVGRTAWPRGLGENPFNMEGDELWAKWVEAGNRVQWRP